MTLRSNKDKSEMNAEVHKTLLSKYGSAFAMSTTKAVDQMARYEMLKRLCRIGGKRESSDNQIDTPGFFQIAEEIVCPWSQDSEDTSETFMFCQIMAEPKVGDDNVPGKIYNHYNAGGKIDVPDKIENTGDDPVVAVEYEIDNAGDEPAVVIEYDYKADDDNVPGESRSDQLPYHHHLFYEEEKANDDDVPGNYVRH